MTLSEKISRLIDLMKEINAELGGERLSIIELETEIDDRRDCFFTIADGEQSIIFGPTADSVRQLTDESLVEEILYYVDGSVRRAGDVVFVAVDTPSGAMLAMLDPAKEIK